MDSNTERKKYDTAHSIASSYGVDAVIGQATRVVWLSLEAGGNQHTSLLPAQLKDWVFKASTNISPHIRIYKSAIVRAVPWWDEEADFSVLQTVRACDSFHGKPWYDGVMYSTSTGQEYGVLRCIFTVDLTNEKAPCAPTAPTYATYTSKTQLALVQKLKTAKTKNLLTKHGCTHLVYDGLKPDGSGNGKYIVVHLSGITRRVYLMPDFSKPKTHLYHNIWKWDRHEKDNRTLAELEGGRYRNGVISD